MSLTATDFREIRSIMREEISTQIEPLTGRIEALENDVKEIYFMISDLRTAITSGK